MHVYNVGVSYIYNVSHWNNWKNFKKLVDILKNKDYTLKHELRYKFLLLGINKWKILITYHSYY